MMDTFEALNVPGPTITNITHPFWDAAQKGRLLLLRCDNCKRAIFYPRRFCPYCWSERVEWFDASGTGRLKTFSVVHRPGHSGWLPAVPYVVGLVALTEGPTMLSLLLVPTVETVVVGLSLRVRFMKVGNRVLPLFGVDTTPANKREEHTITESANV